MQRSLQMVSLTGLLALTSTTAAVAQMGDPPMNRDAVGDPMPLVDEFAGLRAKVAQLEAALERKHQPDSMQQDAMTGGAANRPGMGGGAMAGMGGGSGMAMGDGTDVDGMAGMDDKPGMGSGGKTGSMGMGDASQMGGDGMKGAGGMRSMEDGMAMPKSGSGGGMKAGMGGMDGMPGMDGMDNMDGMDGMGGMGGMKMMGSMKGMSGGGPGGAPGGAGNRSALPGFPGASHLYHTGSTGFFLDHGGHIDLNTEQVASLNGIREKSLLARNTVGREIEQAEQELWELTAADEPDTNLIEEKIREIERMRGDRRLGFIQAVGEAADVLTADQREALLGMGPDGAPSEMPPATPGQADTPAPADHQQHQP